MTALDLLAGAALAAIVVALRRAMRPRTLRDQLDALGPLPPDWRPNPRTVVQSCHLTGGRSW